MPLNKHFLVIHSDRLDYNYDPKDVSKLIVDRPFCGPFFIPEDEEFAIQLNYSKVGEAIKFLLPEHQGGERRGGVMSATVLHTAKTVQKKYPNDYNVRTQDHINMSVQLTATPNWWVFRRGRWHVGNHPDTPPPDVYPDDRSSVGNKQLTVTNQGF